MQVKREGYNMWTISDKIYKIINYAKSRPRMDNDMKPPPVIPLSSHSSPLLAHSLFLLGIVSQTTEEKIPWEGEFIIRKDP